MLLLLALLVIVGLLGVAVAVTGRGNSGDRPMPSIDEHGYLLHRTNS